MDYKAVLFMVISPISAFLMIALNSIEIFIIIKYSRARNADLKPFIYFINLAISDITLGVIILTVKLMSYLEKSINHIHDVRMFLQYKALCLSLYTSILTIAALTVERMIAVKKPIFHQNQISSKFKFRVCCFMWLATTTTIFTLHFTVRNDELEFIVTPVLIIATSIATVLSYFVITNALNQRRDLHKRIGSNSSTHRPFNRFDKTERRYLRFCFHTFLMFLACWSPLTIFGIAFSSGVLNNSHHLLDLRFTAHTVAFWNSVLFPVFFLQHNRLLVKIKEDYVQNNVHVRRFSRAMCSIMSAKSTTVISTVSREYTKEM